MRKIITISLLFLLTIAANAQQKIREVLIMQHSHLDVGFTHLQPVAMNLQVDYINQALDMLDRTADFPEDSRPKWTCEVTEPVMKWLEYADDQNLMRFRRYLETGRVCISALEYNTTPLASSEGLARQLYEASYIANRFGVKINTANLHDATGLPWSIVDLFKDAGVEMLTMAINLHLSGTPKPRPAVYRWQSPGGRELLVMNGEHYSMFDQWTNNNTMNLDTIQDGLNKYLSYVATLNYPYDWVYLSATCAPYAYDNSPPNFDLPGLVRKWNESGRQPRLRFVTPQDILAKVKEIPYASIPVMKGDWTDFWNFGCASSAAETKLSLNTASNMAAIDLLAAFGESNKQLVDARKKTWDDINFYDEHTWGAYNPLEIHHPFPTAQWNMKAFPAYEGMALSKFALTRYLQQLAGNYKTWDHQDGIMLFNPTGATIKSYPRIPGDWTWAGKRIETWLMGGESFERAPADGKFYGPYEVKPYSWMKIPFSQMKEAVAAVPIKSGDNFIETKFYILEFDPKSGKITSVYDKTTKKEILDQSSPYGFFSFVHEKPDPAFEPLRKAFHVRSVENERIGLTGWQPNWKAVYSGISEANCKVETTTLTATLVIRSSGEGVSELVQKITLHADSPIIDLNAEFVKSENVMPEAIYFTFPLNIEKGWKGYFDTGDIPVELDAEQLAGSSHGWETVSSFAGIYGKEAGATLFCPDAPMVMFGDFNFGRKRETIERNANPLLLGWATNNYWETNFRGAQPGLIRVRYAFMPGKYDASAISLTGQEVLNPLVVHPVSDCVKQESGQLVKISGKDMRILYVKEAEDLQGKIIRVVNLGSSPAEAELELPGTTFTSAWLCGITEAPKEVLEVRNSIIKVKLQPRQITSLRVK